MPGMVNCLQESLRLFAGSALVVDHVLQLVLFAKQAAAGVLGDNWALVHVAVQAAVGFFSADTDLARSWQVGW
jgi:hypothetical protein